MQITSLSCPNCQSPLTIEPENSIVRCEYCGTLLSIEDDTVKTDVSAIDQEEAGYLFEKGRQRAQAEQREAELQAYNEQAEAPKKRKTWLWVLGWIFIFPVPLTVLMFKSPRTENMNLLVRILIVAAGWIVYFAIGTSGQ